VLATAIEKRGCQVMRENTEFGEHSLQHLVNELARIEEGLRRARAVIGEKLAPHEAGVQALEQRRQELRVLIAARRSTLRRTSGGAAADDAAADADPLTTTSR
jgi:hypothetical protein